MKKMIILVLALGLSCAAIAQNATFSEENNTPISENYGLANKPVDVKDLNISGLKKFIETQLIVNNPDFFTDKDIEMVKNKIKEINNSVDNDISSIKRIISDLVIVKQNLLKLNDVPKIKEQITEKEKGTEKIKEAIRTDLSSIGYKGLMLVCIKNIKALDSKEQLSSISEKAMLPKAIENYNGVFINSLQIVKNNILLSDYIKSVLQGEMNIEKKIITNTMRKDKMFIYVAKVNISPMKENITTQSSVPENDLSTNLVIDLLKEDDFKAKLSAYGVSKQTVIEIESEVNSAKNTITNENYMSGKREETILKEGNNNIQRLNKEIMELKQTVADKENELQKILETTTNIVYDPNNFSNCIGEGIKFVDNEIKNITNEMLIIKEKELFYQLTNVTSEGSPSEDISKATLSVLSQIRSSYSKIEKFMEITVVNNNMTESFDAGYKKDIFREIDKIWLYPVTANNDNFNLTVAAKFKISNIQPLPIGYSSVFEKYKNLFSYKAKQQDPVPVVAAPVAPVVAKVETPVVQAPATIKPVDKKPEIIKPKQEKPVVIKNNIAEIKKIEPAKKSEELPKPVIVNQNPEKSYFWWYVGGGVAVAGGVAAVLLMGGEDKTETPAANSGTVNFNIPLP